MGVDDLLEVVRGGRRERIQAAGARGLEVAQRIAHDDLGVGPAARRQIIDHLECLDGLRAGRRKGQLVGRVDRVETQAQLAYEGGELVARVGGVGALRVEDRLEVEAHAIDAARADLGDDVGDKRGTRGRIAQQ